MQSEKKSYSCCDRVTTWLVQLCLHLSQPELDTVNQLAPLLILRRHRGILVSLLFTCGLCRLPPCLHAPTAMSTGSWHSAIYNQCFNFHSIYSFGKCLLFPFSAENWRPFCSSRRSLMRSDNELCFIYTPVAQCCYVTIYWLLQTDSVNTVRWSGSSNVIMPPLSLIHIWRCRRSTLCRSRWSPYH